MRQVLLTVSHWVDIDTNGDSLMVDWSAELKESPMVSQMALYSAWQTVVCLAEMMAAG